VITLEQIYKEHGKRLYSLAYRMTGNKDDASDILQETFLQVSKLADTFRGESQLYTWLYQITKNNCLRFLQKKKRSSFASLQDIVYKASVPVSEEITETQKSLYIAQVKDGCLSGLLRCLSLQQRLAFVLNVLLDFPVAQVATVIDKSENATRVLISRAKENIREFLCANCSLYKASNHCRCENLIHFSLKQGWINANETDFPSKLEKEIKTLKSVVNLYKTLNEKTPDEAIQLKISELLDEKKDFLIFSPKKVK
jgi:RNA polymerase sigma factor (sigma-70 family)